ncbi:DgyrCDS6114 [Dimorphilus gyrociliatus]|uniref:DgyrCDS6114 n=1 Tax=Dimorphilus gyrociliatus TaxID=2664684 RepID=A0A7I8VNL7_9ANNE|nr:DgyrCDS6114 [Dimorphilus gyrociliatus]
MQTISRYYSNAFSDNDKQQAINVFLGLYKPEAGKTNVWELGTDFYLHNQELFTLNRNFIKRNYTNWCSPEIGDCLPLPYDLVHKKPATIYSLYPDDVRIDWFTERYKGNKYVSIDDEFLFRQLLSSKEFRPQDSSRKKLTKNVSSKCSEDGSEKEESSSSNEEEDYDYDFDLSLPKSRAISSYESKENTKTYFNNMKESYGMELNNLSSNSIDNELYKNYSEMYECATGRNKTKSYFSLINRGSNEVLALKLQSDQTIKDSREVYSKTVKSATVSDAWVLSSPPIFSKICYEEYFSLGHQ